MSNMEKLKDMKKRSLILAGSMGAGVLLILALFPAVVSAQKSKLRRNTDKYYSTF